MLTDEEQRILDQDWIGRDGSKRKVEVSSYDITAKTSG